MLLQLPVTVVDNLARYAGTRPAGIEIDQLP